MAVKSGDIRVMVEIVHHLTYLTVACLRLRFEFEIGGCDRSSKKRQFEEAVAKGYHKPHGMRKAKKQGRYILWEFN